MKIEHAFERLSNAHRSNRLAQGYIFAGPPDTVGSELAVKVLQMLFCPSGTGTDLCGDCHKISERKHFDVLWVEPQMRSRTISIAQVCELQARMTQTALVGKWKAAVIVGADRLGPEASNAFLKTLEEPPSHTIFLLLSENPQYMLTTIRSRCQMIQLDGAARLPEAVEAELIKIMTEPNVSQAVSAGSRHIGGFAQSDALVRMLKAIKDAAEAQELERVGDEEVEDDVINARATARYKEIRTGIMRAMCMWYRDLMILTCGGQEESVHFNAYLPTLRELSQKLKAPDAVRRVRAVEWMNEQLERNLPEVVVFDNGLPILQII